MKIAIISDTHDNMRILNKTVNYLNLISIDLLIHCGDWDMPFTMRGLIGAKFPIKSVLGNGDPDIQKFLYQLQNLDVLKDLKLDIQLRMQDFILDGKRICVFHGDDTALWPECGEDLIAWAGFVQAVEVQPRRPVLKKFPALFYGKPDPSF